MFYKSQTAMTLLLLTYSFLDLSFLLSVLFQPVADETAHSKSVFSENRI